MKRAITIVCVLCAFWAIVTWQTSCDVPVDEEVSLPDGLSFEANTESSSGLDASENVSSDASEDVSEEQSNMEAENVEAASERGMTGKRAFVMLSDYKVSKLVTLDLDANTWGDTEVAGLAGDTVMRLRGERLF
ncbi:MAG: hypothetical protein AAGJ35_06125, partial [Myxococcota bacterium]